MASVKPLLDVRQTKVGTLVHEHSRGCKSPWIKKEKKLFTKQCVEFTFIREKKALVYLWLIKYKVRKALHNLQ